MFGELNSWEGLFLNREQLEILPSMRKEVIELAHDTRGFGTGFDILKPVLEEMWMRHGMPWKVTQNGILCINLMNGRDMLQRLVSRYISALWSTNRQMGW